MRGREIVRDALPLWVWYRLRGTRRRSLPKPPRRFHAYVVGVARTGTTSMARMFRSSYRAAHEPDPGIVVTALERQERGRVSRRGLLRFLRRRDHLLHLELESSHLLGPFVDLLVELFPHAGFVLTTRDCFTWLESMIGLQLGNRAPLRARSPGSSDTWRRWFRYAYRTSEPMTYAPEEAALQELGLPPVERYLAHWREQNARVLAAVPAERLLIVRTAEISRRLGDIADFVGVEKDTLDRRGRHANARPGKPLSLLDAVGSAFLDQEAERCCGDVMRLLFPEVGSAEEALGDAVADGAGNP